MNVLLLNGSPHRDGCTYTALREVADALERAGIATTLLHISQPASPCTGCGICRETGRCVMHDQVNEVLALAEQADGFIFGSPVHYAGPAGHFTSFLDRLFYAGTCFAHKPGAAVVSCRRGGSSAAFDRLNKYFTISQMPVVSSQYWNSVHGNTPAEVRRDLEGMQTMRLLGKNMAYLLQCKEAGQKAGILPPKSEPRLYTSLAD
ncbi:MAG: flavodoxin family protein [Oscillospiraceae bacterium]